MNLKISMLLGMTLLLSGCDKVQSVVGSNVSCGDEDAKKLVVEAFSKSLSEVSSQRVKNLIADENITIDMGKLRAALKQITFNVNDVRTTNSDPNSKKEYCVTEFIVKIPDQIIKDADAARAVYEQTNVAQSAVISDLSLEMNQIKKDLDYYVQPTDDGKKVYVGLENPDSLASFVSDVAVDSLLKAARQNAAELLKQEQLKEDAQQAADAQEYQSVLIGEAQASLDQANENLNLVWNATTSDVRSQLLDEQKMWLKKRTLECKLNSTGTDNPEVYRRNCETTMTNQRTNELRQKIYYLES
ncbi:lysozyme inhibitor LprI family protein [Acinetobacter wuhouensis]|nr:lysozyme inhibitor LprI family protein [Acinetobacter wuhouensis]